MGTIDGTRRGTLLALLLLAPISPRAQAPAVPPPPAAEVAPGALSVPPPPPPAPEPAKAAAAEARPEDAGKAGAKADDLPRVGFMLDVGLPDLLGVSVVGRPLPWLRPSFGLTYSYVFWGLRGGVAFVPWVAAVAPSLTLEYGRSFTTDVSSKVSVPTDLKEPLSRVNYDFFTAALGIEIGSGVGGAFFVNLGLTTARMRAAAATVPGSGQTLSTDLGQTTVRYKGPVARLGFIKYF